MVIVDGHCMSARSHLVTRRAEAAVLDEVLRTVRRIAGVDELGPHAPLLQAGLDSLGAHACCVVCYFWLMNDPDRFTSSWSGHHRLRTTCRGRVLALMTGWYANMPTHDSDMCGHPAAASGQELRCLMATRSGPCFITEDVSSSQSH